MEYYQKPFGHLSEKAMQILTQRRNVSSIDNSDVKFEDGARNVYLSNRSHPVQRYA